jgi:hypothetical protein
MRYFFFLFTPIFISFQSCHSNNKHYSLSIKHLAGAAGLTRIYEISEKGILVKTNCHFENCKETIVYKIDFRKEQADSILNTIDALRLDTLKKSYSTDMYDGLYSEIELNLGTLTKKIGLSNYELPSTDSLFRLIDNQILVTKYRFYNWGKE